ncbi:flagellar basal body rod protein FlgB [Pelosinus sp. sgz500959]|uniref:flagellar basal body rod protein FlgB n=1 Tax=Pelosinus sp. sgz500959 TaxID=3242472 RepID=UPI003673245C
MLNSILSSPRVAVLEQALSASSLRQKVISNNIANVNTPGYKKSEVSFEDMLQNAIGGDKLPMVKTNERHLGMGKDSIPNPQINTMSNTSIRTDGNNVDIDVEMADLAKNSIYYNAVVQQISNYFSGIKSAIKEGR